MFVRGKFFLEGKYERKAKAFHGKNLAKPMSMGGLLALRKNISLD